MLRPAALADATGVLRRSNLTLSCSYHVALTSLLLEVPTVLISDNPYYEQKAAGLREAFGLPPEFTVSTDADPRERAAAIAGAVLDEDAGDALCRSLTAGRDLLLQRRAMTEVELLGRLGSAAVSALGDRIGEMTERLRERATEPAELHAQLAILRFDYQELERRTGEKGSRLEAQPERNAAAPAAMPPGDEAVAVGAALVAAEARAQEAEARSAEAQEMVSTVLTSRSWRLTTPLRRAAARLRRSRRR